MDAVRYWIAVLVVAFYPGALLYWFSIHPLIGFWRRAGARLTLAIHYGLILALAAVIYRARGPLLAVEFGTNWWLCAAGAVLMIGSGIMRRKLGRHLTPRVLQGIPELSSDKRASKLITVGIYSRVRNPRYIQLLLAVAGYALITNYLAVYALAVAGPLIVALIVRIEEKELRARFGEEYVEYCARVPRFIPRRPTPAQRGGSG